MIDKKTGLPRICFYCKSDKTYIVPSTGAVQWRRVNEEWSCRKCYFSVHYRRYWYQKNRDKALEYAKMYRTKNKETIKEKTKLYRKNNHERKKMWERAYYQRNIEKIRTNRKRIYYLKQDETLQAIKVYRDKIKRDAIEFYSKGSMSCKCCGETTYDFLTFDHINGRNGLNLKTVMPLWLRKHNYPSGIQILCYNCNCAKGKLGYCPHEKLVKASVVSIQRYTA